MIFRYRSDLKPISRQKPDFYVPEVQLVIEVDVPQHLEPEMKEKDNV